MTDITMYADAKDDKGKSVEKIDGNEGWAVTSGKSKLGVVYSAAVGAFVYPFDYRRLKSGQPHGNASQEAKV